MTQGTIRGSMQSEPLYNVKDQVSEQFEESRLEGFRFEYKDYVG